MDKHLKMEQHNIGGLILAVSSWITTQFLLYIQMPSLAQYSSICVIIGVIWTFIANADRAVSNIDKFTKWIKNKSK